MPRDPRADIDYYSYSLIARLLAENREKCLREYVAAQDYYAEAGDEADAKARECFRESMTSRHRAERFLLALIREHYSQHPDAEVRRFWGCRENNEEQAYAQPDSALPTE